MKIDNTLGVYSTIDTTQTRDKIINRLDADRKILGRTTIKKDGENITDKWNVNYSQYHTALSSTVEELKQMFELATVVDDKITKINRIDVATDLDVDFKDIDKFISFYFLCFTEGLDGVRRRWTDMELEEVDALWFKKQYLEVQYYNKAKQALENGFKAKYATRLEVRLKRTEKQDFGYHVDRTIKMYQDVPEKISYVEQDRIKLLCKKWDEFKAENEKATLTHFVVAWESKIYTRGILEGLYKYVGLKGSIASWIKKFRQGYKLELFTDKDIIKLNKKIIKSLKEYKKK